MTIINKSTPWLILLFMGTAWGLSFSLAKIAMEAGGSAFGITLWQSIISFVAIYCVSLTRQPFRLQQANIKLFLVISLLGASIPGVLFYYAAARIPAGILAITIALVPVMTYSMALPMRLETATAARLLGITLGAAAILFLVLPETSLPDQGSVPWVLLACVASGCYAGENIILSNRFAQKIGAIRLACGMNLFSVLTLLPITLITGQFIMPRFPLQTIEFSILALGFLNAGAYTLFVLTVQRYGPIFASQTGYIVTLSGVFWGVVIFQETHSLWVWASLVTLILGLALVAPRRSKSH